VARRPPLRFTSRHTRRVPGTSAGHDDEVVWYAIERIFTELRGASRLFAFDETPLG
jgi:hypothetical protein